MKHKVILNVCPCINVTKIAASICPFVCLSIMKVIILYAGSDDNVYYSKQ